MLIATPPVAAAGAPPSRPRRGNDRRQPAERDAADPLDKIDPALHRAVRDAYRGSIRRGATQRQAFDAATEVFAADRPQSDAEEARRLVALMLAHEPPPEA